MTRCAAVDAEVRAVLPASLEAVEGFFAGFRQRSRGYDFAVIGRIVVKVHNRQEVRRLASLVTGANKEEFPLLFLVVFCADALRRSHQQGSTEKYMERQGCAPVCHELKHFLFLP